MSLKSILKLYSIPLFIVILGVFLYFIMFIELSEKKLPHLYAQYKDNKPESTQEVSKDKHATKPDTQPIMAQTHDTEAEIISNTQNPTQETTNHLTTNMHEIQKPQTIQEAQQTHSAQQSIADTLPQSPQQIPQTLDTPQIRYVNVRSANIRALPNTDSAVLYRAYEGQQLLLVQTLPQNEWSEVEVDSKIRGYIASYLLSTNAPQNNIQSLNVIPQDPTMPQIIVKSANIRALPSSDAPVITTLKLGQSVQVLQDDGEWSKIFLDNGQEGYIASRLLSK